jgi:hypothetical protein
MFILFIQTVQPEDLTNQTRVLESIERVLESLTEKTANWTLSFIHSLQRGSNEHSR